jgi:ribonuclease VapC
MVIDTSAILAIFLGEPERSQFLELLRQADSRLFSAGNALEAAIVLEARRGDSVIRELDLFVHRTKVDIVPVDVEQVEVARAAWRIYGKGRHPAGLNFGDCFAYALAKTSDEPLLAAGAVFARTDIVMCA